MNNNEDISPEDLEEIERYLGREMSASERQTFESRLSSESQLRVQTEELRIISTGIREQTLRRQLNEFHQPILKDKNNHAGGGIVKQFSWRRWMSAAAIVIAIAAATWFVLFKPSSQAALLTHYYLPDPGLMTTMGGSEDYQLNRAMIDYKTGNYDSAISRWQLLVSPEIINDTLNYFLGSAHLAKKQYEKSLPLFQAVIKDSGSVFREDAYWYAGLAALVLNKKDLAIQYIRQSSHNEKEKILSELEK